MSASLTVVMPVYDEARHLRDTVAAVVEAVSRSGFHADVVLVDDGSTDGSTDVVRSALSGRLPLRVVHQANRGRFEARRVGVEAATGKYVLLLDGRVRIHPGALAFVRPRLDAGEHVWTSDVHVLDAGTPLGMFWRLLPELAWSEYFDDPKTTSFGAEDFDRFPKGTTCLLAPRELLLAAIAQFRTVYEDTRNANDDTLLLRWIAEREPIHVSPSYASSYVPRTSLRSFLRHAYRRGIVFVDGHGRRSSRFFSVAAAFYPASVLWALMLARRRAVLPATLVGSVVSAAAYALVRRRSAREAVALGIATPVYAVGHGAGMWFGLLLILRARLRRTR